MTLETFLQYNRSMHGVWLSLMNLFVRVLVLGKSDWSLPVSGAGVQEVARCLYFPRRSAACARHAARAAEGVRGHWSHLRGIG